MVRILIADDHEIVRAGFRRLIEAHTNWEVVAEADDGEDAVSKAVETAPDVAVLDCAMPLITGIEATRQIRARVPRTEVLIFSAHDREELVRECLKAGARGYVLKSNVNEDLLDAIGSLAEHKPFFTTTISEFLLDSFLEMPIRNVTQVAALAARKPRALERSVLEMVAEGHTNEQIAKLFNINLKLVAALVNYANRNGLLER